MTSVRTTTITKENDNVRPTKRRKTKSDTFDLKKFLENVRRGKKLKKYIKFIITNIDLLQEFTWEKVRQNATTANQHDGMVKDSDLILFIKQLTKSGQKKIHTVLGKDAGDAFFKNLVNLGDLLPGLEPDSKLTAQQFDLLLQVFKLKTAQKKLFGAELTPSDNIFVTKFLEFFADANFRNKTVTNHRLMTTIFKNESLRNDFLKKIIDVEKEWTAFDLLFENNTDEREKLVEFMCKQGKAKVTVARSIITVISRDVTDRQDLIPDENNSTSIKMKTRIRFIKNKISNFLTAQSTNVPQQLPQQDTSGGQTSSQAPTAIARPNYVTNFFTCLETGRFDALIASFQSLPINKQLNLVKKAVESTLTDNLSHLLQLFIHTLKINSEPAFQYYICHAENKLSLIEKIIKTNNVEMIRFLAYTAIPGSNPNSTYIRLYAATKFDGFNLITQPDQRKIVIDTLTFFANLNLPIDVMKKLIFEFCSVFNQFPLVTLFSEITPSEDRADAWKRNLTSLLLDYLRKDQPDRSPQQINVWQQHVLGKIDKSLKEKRKMSLRGYLGNHFKLLENALWATQRRIVETNLPSPSPAAQFSDVQEEQRHRSSSDCSQQPSNATTEDLIQENLKKAMATVYRDLTNFLKSTLEIGLDNLTKQMITNMQEQAACNQEIDTIIERLVEQRYDFNHPKEQDQNHTQQPRAEVRSSTQPSRSHFQSSTQANLGASGAYSSIWRTPEPQNTATQTATKGRDEEFHP